MALNVKSKCPVSPGWWVTKTECCCGATYKKFRAWPDWQLARLRIKMRAERYNAEAYISRGPVLWEMRVMKLEQWYLEHAQCEPF